MITLTTGVPGSGKSLYTINYVKTKAEAENRQVYYHGIKDLALPWEELADPRDWDNLPTGAIIVIDECQTVFRPRGTGTQVPHYIAAMETHRHKGYDIFLITQHPMLVDQNIRRLVGQHFHVVRKFGMERATIHEFGSCHEITQRNMAQALRKEFRYPKEAYSYYKSAELHTHKRRIPARVWFLLASPLLIAALLYVGYRSIRSASDVKSHIDQPSAAASPAQTGSGITTTVVDTNPKQAYLEQHVPRIADMPWTAPVYDDVTKPQDAPRPVACIVNHNADRCRCTDQQGGTLHVSDNMCRNIVQHGIFLAWRPPADGATADSRTRRQDARPAPISADPASVPPV